MAAFGYRDCRCLRKKSRPDTLFAAPMPYLPRRPDPPSRELRRARSRPVVAAGRRRNSNAGDMECEKCGLALAGEPQQLVELLLVQRLRNVLEGHCILHQRVEADHLIEL